MTTLASAPISREPEKHGARMVCPFTFSLGLGLTTLTSSHMRRDRPRLLQSYSTRPCSHIAGIESIYGLITPCKNDYAIRVSNDDNDG